MRELAASDAKVLIIGSGGREHALGLALKEAKVKTLYFTPGNAGTQELGHNINLDVNNFNSIHELVKKEKIDLIIVGPEKPLANGIVDYFNQQDIRIIGPTKEAAQIEVSKIYARELMDTAGIPGPQFRVCPNQTATKRAIKKIGLPLVLKVDGLAEGKGAFVCHTPEETINACRVIYDEQKFGVTEILVEECLEGQEMSCFFLADAFDIKFIGSAQDYKRLNNNDQGPNTGGMGAIAPSPLMTPKLLEKIETLIVEPILSLIEASGEPYTGFLYCGLMIKNGQPAVIEFNARLGDPETQVILPLIKNNLFELLWRAAQDELYSYDQVELRDCQAAYVVKAMTGYPDMYLKGKEIKFTNNSNRIIQAGTKNVNGQILTNGGRVLGALGLGSNLTAAIKDAYVMLDQVHFEGEYFRTDIGRHHKK